MGVIWVSSCSIIVSRRYLVLSIHQIISILDFNISHFITWPKKFESHLRVILGDLVSASRNTVSFYSVFLSMKFVEFSLVSKKIGRYLSLVPPVHPTNCWTLHFCFTKCKGIQPERINGNLSLSWLTTKKLQKRINRLICLIYYTEYC